MYLTGTHGVAFLLGAEVVVVAGAGVVAEALAPVALVIEVPARYVKTFAVRAYAFVFALKADCSCLVKYKL